MALYQSGEQYGSGTRYGSFADIGVVPQDLRYYRTSTDGVYVFHWGFNPSDISPLLASAGFVLQLDTDTSFSSPNFVQFTQVTVITYLNGNVRKGFTVAVSPRQDGVTQTWYARVQSVLDVTSNFSTILTWTIPPRTELQEATNLINNLPDFHVYGKESLLIPLNKRIKYLTWVIMDMYAKEFDRVGLENYMTSTDNLVQFCRDENLYNDWGIQFKYSKPQQQTTIEYRECIAALINASLEGGTIDAIQKVVSSFTGVPANIQLLRDVQDFFLNTVLDDPIVPSGPQTFFPTQYPYIQNAIQVEDITTGLLVSPASYTENPSAPLHFTIVGVTNMTHLHVNKTLGMKVNDIIQQDPPTVPSAVFTTITAITDDTHIVVTDTTGFVAGPAIDTTAQAGGWTMHTATNHTLQAIYDIGRQGEPTPVVNGLSGVYTFINGNAAVTGVGTKATTELAPGYVMTDIYGNQATVLNITDDTHLTLTVPWAHANESAQMYLVALPDLLLWEAQTLAYGLNIIVENPGMFVLDKTLIETLVNLILPAHVKVYYTFV
jgi:hypothetical protein